MKEKLKFIPNVLCIIRIILVFVFIVLALGEDDRKLYYALVVFLMAGATDVLDGFLARRNNWITELGKILDPLADKLMQCTVLVVLSSKGILPYWFALVFILKELVTLSMGLLVIKRRSVVVVSRWYGKAAACLFYVTVTLSVLLKDFLVDRPSLYAFLFVPAATFAVGAFVAYVKYYYSSLKHKTPVCQDAEKVNESL